MGFLSTCKWSGSALPTDAMCQQKATCCGVVDVVDSLNVTSMTGTSQFCRFKNTVEQAIDGLCLGSSQQGCHSDDTDLESLCGRLWPAAMSGCSHGNEVDLTDVIAALGLPELSYPVDQAHLHQIPAHPEGATLGDVPCTTHTSPLPTLLCVDIGMPADYLSTISLEVCNRCEPAHTSRPGDGAAIHASHWGSNYPQNLVIWCPPPLPPGAVLK